MTLTSDGEHERIERDECFRIPHIVRTASSRQARDMDEAEERQLAVRKSADQTGFNLDARKPSIRVVGYLDSNRIQVAAMLHKKPSVVLRERWSGKARNPQNSRVDFRHSATSDVKSTPETGYETPQNPPQISPKSSQILAN